MHGVTRAREITQAKGLASAQSDAIAGASTLFKNVFFSVCACSQPVDAGALPRIARLRIVQVHSPSKSGFGTMESFRNTLLTDPKLTPCRDAMPRNPPFFLPSGSLMIVTPEQYENVRHALINSELKPYNLVSASTLRDLSRK